MPRRRDTPEEKKRKQEQESWAATQARNDAYLRTGNIQPKDPAEPVPSVEPDDVPTPKPDPEDTFFTAEQLQTMTFPPLEWALPQIIPAEGVTLLCSKPKFGKSWLAYDLCIAFLTSGDGVGFGNVDDIAPLSGLGSQTNTPLPAALPLFASGAGVLGYFGWRRKRKKATAAVH